MKTKRIFSTVLAIVLVLSTLTFGGFTASADVTEVYVDAVNGSASAAGTLDAPLNALAPAFAKLTGDGTVYVIGEYNTETTSFPSSQYTVTLSGYGADAKIVCTKSFGVLANSDLIIKNIDFVLGQYAHFNTNGHKVVFGEGYKMSSSSAQVHVGNMSGNTKGEHFVIDGGAVLSRPTSIGGAYITNPNQGINGNVTVEVLDGTLDQLKLSQDGYLPEHKSVTIAGDVRVKVGANGKIKSMNNTGRYSVVKGYLHLIVEDGGSMCTLDMTNFVNQKYFNVAVTPSEHGTVDFSDKTGYVSINCKDGYVAKIATSTGVGYVGTSEYQLPLGEKVSISFTDEVKLAPSTVDITIEAPVPGSNNWPISVSDNKFAVEVVSHTPNDATAEYATQYTYSINIKTADGFVYPADFTFTVNGLEAFDKQTNPGGYRAIGLKKVDASTYNFGFKTDYTETDTTRTMVSYYGGVGAATDPSKTAPRNTFYANGSDITIGENYFVMGGYKFIGYKDDVNGVVYQPGDTYTLSGNVVFTAQWEEVQTYQVVFQGNGNTSGEAPDSITGKLTGETAIVPANPFSKIGYVFTGWNGDDGNIYNPGDLIVIGTSNLTLYANWAVNPIAGTMYYVSGAGLDSNDGLSVDAPLASLEKAYELAAGTNATIVIIGTVNALANLPAHDANITITGYDEDSVLVIANNLTLNGDTAIENIGIETSAGKAIITNGKKAVIGPNLTYTTSSKLDIIDGGNGVSVDAIDTTINAGVQINNYYFGGANLVDSTTGVTGDANVVINGAEITNLDFSPKGEVTANVDGLIALNVNDGKIGTFKASKALTANTSKVTIIFFSNGTIPAGFADNDSLISKLTARTAKTYVIDSGVGGSAVVTNTTRAVCKGTAVVGDVYTCLAGNKTYTKSRTGSFTSKAVANGVNKVRYGTPFADTIEVSVSNPTAGSEARSIAPTITNGVDICKILLDGWSPALAGGRFDYDETYTATVSFVPEAGNFFNDISLPEILINGVVAETSLNSDGSLNALYTFEPTDYVRPQIAVTLYAGSYDADATNIYGSVIDTITVGHMETKPLPANTLTYLGFRFVGWRDLQTGEVYRAGSNYTASSTDSISLVADWEQRGSVSLPNVLILYDMTVYASDRGRNPKFPDGADVITVNKAFATLEHDINGSKSTKTTDFDHEENVTIITSDGGDFPMKINNYVLDQSKADANQYKYMTIVYYYQTKNGAAVGDYGFVNYGNAKQPDGTNSKWVGKGINSKETVVANKWATVTFDLTEAVESAGFPDGSLIRQCHICPIGNKKCSELAGDTLYLKAMYLSKLPPVTE